MQSESALPELPCYPCPYNASCCAYGTTLSEEEAAAIEKHVGAGLVMQTRWGEWRTRVRNKRCVLYRNGGCSVHDQPFYPSLCRGFPWTNGDGEPYEYDIDICGALADQQLVTIQPRARSA